MRKVNFMGLIVIIILSVIYAPIFSYAEKYNRSRVAYFFGLMIFTPVFTGLYLFFVIRRKKKEGYTAKKLSKKSLLINVFLALIFMLIMVSIKVASQI